MVIRPVARAGVEEMIDGHKANLPAAQPAARAAARIPASHGDALGPGDPEGATAARAKRTDEGLARRCLEAGEMCAWTGGGG
jgi:hypothetical protein